MMQEQRVNIKNKLKVIVKDIGTGNNIKRLRLRLMKLKNKLMNK